MHEYLAPATLLTAIFAGIWLNRRDYSTLKEDLQRRIVELRDDMNRQFGEAERKLSDLRTDMDRQFGEVNRRLGLIEADQKQFYTVTGKLDGRLDELSKR